MKILKEKTSIEEANVFRKLILRISPLILSKNIIFIGKTLSIISEYIPTLNILPMRREEDENFSTEDPNNVSIPSSLGPIMHEIWSYLIFASKNEGNKDRNTIVNFKSFYDIFKKILFRYKRLLQTDRSFLKCIRLCISGMSHCQIQRKSAWCHISVFFFCRECFGLYSLNIL